MTGRRTNLSRLFDRIALLLGAKPSRSDTRESGIAISNEILALSHEDRETVLRLLGSSPEGLNVSEADERLKTVGPNLITQEERPNILRELAGRAENPLNGLLLSLAFISYLLGDLRAAIVIAIMVALAIATAFVQEHRSNDAAAKLRAMVKHTASVRRRGLSGSGRGPL